jgi:hypothetical protein
MNALYRRLLSLSLILNLSQFHSWATDPLSVHEEQDSYAFSVEPSNSFHPRYGNLLTISFQNSTGHSLRNHRIFAMQLIDLNESYVPGNVVEHIWSFVDDTEEVVLPLLNLGLTLAVYRGQFNEEIPDLVVIEASASKQVFIWDGAEMNLDIKAIRLIAR